MPRAFLANPGRWRGSAYKALLLSSLACLLAAIPASEIWAETREVPPTRSGPLRDLLSPGPAALSLRSDAAGVLDVSTGSTLVGRDFALGQGPAFRKSQAASSALLTRYHMALQRESRRAIEKDPSLFWGDKTDEDGYPRDSLRREANRIFSGANNRLMSQILEDALRNTTTLKRARAFAEGIRLDVLSGGGVKVGAGGGDDAAQNVSASIGFIVLGRPRVEVRTTLPGGVRTKVELPLTSLGIRASMSRRISANVRGTFSGGVEDGGDDRWVSAGVELRF